MTTATLSSRSTGTGTARALRASERRGARRAGWALLGVTVVSLPAAALLGRADEPGTRVALGTAFAVVAVLDLVVAAGLHGLLRARAHSSAYAALVSRSGYAVLLGASASRLAWPGGGGVEAFRADCSLALLVLGLHLVVTATALRTSRVVPVVVTAMTALAGAAGLLGQVLTRWADVGWRPVLVPLVAGELVLTGWLLLVAHRRTGRTGTTTALVSSKTSPAPGR